MFVQYDVAAQPSSLGCMSGTFTLSRVSLYARQDAGFVAPDFTKDCDDPNLIRIHPVSSTKVIDICNMSHGQLDVSLNFLDDAGAAHEANWRMSRTLLGVLMNSATRAALVAMGLSGCNSSSPQPNPPAPKAAYDISSGDGIKFLLGPVGIQADLTQIESGTKLGEMWTYVSIPSAVLDPQTASSTVQMNTDGIAVSDEFFANDPSSHSGTVDDYRFDFTTSAAITSGKLVFDRSATGTVYVDISYKGLSTLYSSTPTYTEWEITTGFPIQK